MRRLDSRLIYGGEDSGAFSVTYRPIFFVKKLVGQLTVLNICTVLYRILVQYSTLTQLWIGGSRSNAIILVER